ncbi:MAG: glycosyltransferase family 4 protein [Parvularcula sp.]|jgi:glycosyltransferase involved in cell wall biosynthesis|nr:glycosyltransferase family 4 protein [Parvularcula sp.]
MKVGYLLNTYPAPSGTFIRREIEALERRGVEVTRFAVRRFEGELVDPRDLSEADITNYLLSGNAKELASAFLRELARNPQGVGKAMVAARRIAQDMGEWVRPLAYLAEAALLKQQAKAAELTHIHTHFSTNAPAVAMLCRLMGGPPFSWTAHGPDEFVSPERVSFDLKMQHAAFAVAISHYAKMQLIRWGGPEFRHKIVVGRCGLDLRDFKVSDVPVEKRLVCVGRLCPQKGQSLIPEAIAPIAREHRDLEIILVGDGESRPEIENEIELLGLTGQFTLKGWATNAEVRALISSSRALLLPSFAEGLPIVIMEAFALGRPAISTYIAGIPELLDRDCGWIVPPSSTEDLRAAITAAIETSPMKLNRMGREGRRRIEERHDVDQLAALLKDRFAAPQP